MLLSSIMPRFALAVGLVLSPLLEAKAQTDTFEGPTNPQGISFEVLGSIDLGPEYPDIEGMASRSLRVRHWVIEPNGIVPVHGHDNRPAIIYILTGEIVEHRDDQDEPVLHRAGEVSLENGGVMHWWQNEGDAVVELVAVDIVQDR